MTSPLPEHTARDLRSQGHASVDVTDGIAVLEVQGRATRALLSKGCGLDFHPQSFPTARCARTRFAKITLVIECVDQSPRFYLYVARSYLHYLRAWLIDAAAEFGLEAT
jgi:sarcosine oxidase subunit gamma